MKKIFTILIVLVILGGVYYIFKDSMDFESWFSPAPRTDSVYIPGDTVWIPSDTVFFVQWKYKKADTETVYVAGSDSGLIKKSSEVDTSLVHNQDTIKVKAKVDYYPEPDYFDWLMNIEHKDYDFQRVDTIKVHTVEEKTNWLWIITTIVSVILLGLSLIGG